MLNLYAIFINVFEQNSAVFAGKIDNGSYIWYNIIVSNDDESIINDKGIANILANKEVRFNTEKWYMLNGSTAINANIFVDKNESNFIKIFFIIFVLFIFFII